MSTKFVADYPFKRVIMYFFDLQVDIIVSSQGACSKAIIRSGGLEMRDSVKSLHTGDVIVTPGFGLPCSHVIHTKCSEWDSGTGETVSFLG